MRNAKQRIILKKPLYAILIASCVAVIYIYSLFLVTAVKIWSSQFEDLAFRIRHKHYSIAAKDYIRPKDIVLVTIDEESYKVLGRKWPWTRDIFADFLDKMAEYKPKVIALDFALHGQSVDNPEADTKLADAIKRCGNVIIASAYGRERQYLEPYDIFAEASAGHGVIGSVRDEDNAIRRFSTSVLIFLPQKGDDMPFEIKAAAYYLDVPYDKISRKKDGITLESKDKRNVIPIDENGDILINYLSDTEDIKTISIWRVLKDELPKDVFKNKLVLVSQTGEIFRDFNATPLGYRHGGLIITNVLNSIITSSYIKRGAPLVTIPIIGLIYILAFAAFYHFQPIKGFFTLISIIAACLGASFSMFLNGIMWPTFYTIGLLPILFLGIMFHKYTTMVLEGAEIKRMAITDSLTSLYTHRYFRLLLEHTAYKTLSSHSECSLVIIRILNIERIIKEINFNRGQIVQKEMAELIRMKLPRNASGAYLSMGEISMLLPKVGVHEALGIAGSLRNHIKREDFGISEPILKPIVAIGVSAIDPAMFPKTGDDLIKSARAAVLRAKNMGYNKICRFNPKIDKSVFRADVAVIGRKIKQRLNDEFSFLAIDLEERSKELEELLRQLSLAQRDLEKAHFETLHSLVIALEEKDPCTAGHSERVGKYAEKIGRKLKMPEEELIRLRQAGILHDIGKVGIPQNILRKEEELEPVERHVIELHPEFSVRILKTSKYFNKILSTIRDHHERLDGSGYPRGLKGERISLKAQIISVCDVFDAMTTDRPYRKALLPAEVLEGMLAHPEQYNRNIALSLKQILKEERRKK